MANPEDLGRYQLKRLLGRGAMGEVWEANDLEEEGNKVAVKIMHAAEDELAVARSHFAQEALLVSQMRHPNVVLVHDAGEAAGTSFLVMDMVEGRSLRAVFGDESVTVEEKLSWLHQIADGLSAMHDAGVVHRDLKPENIIVRADGTVCLVDLGIAKWAKFDLGLSTDPERLDSPERGPSPPTDYTPPETKKTQLYDELGDQYAWGVIAHELLAGEVPRDADQDEERSAPITPPGLARVHENGVPARTVEAIGRALSIRRESRFDSMRDLLDQLGDPSRTPLTSAVPVAPVAPEASVASANGPAKVKGMAATKEATPKKEGKPAFLVGILVLLLLLAVGVVVAFR